MLRNPTYTGQLFAGRWRRREAKRRLSPLRPIGLSGGEVRVLPQEWTFVTKIPAIITEEQFELVQAKLARNLACARRNNKVHDYLLRALVSCGLCKTGVPGQDDEQEEQLLHLPEQDGAAQLAARRILSGALHSGQAVGRSGVAGLV